MELESVFNGHYYDGKSAKSRPCLITLEADGLLIAFSDDLGPADTFWHREGIHPAEFNDSKHSKLQFGPYPRETVEVDGRGFFDALEANYPSAPFTVPVHGFLTRFGWRGLVSGVAIAVAIMASAYLWVIPVFADNLAQQMPRAAEHKLGAQLAQSELFGRVDVTRTAALEGFVRNLKLDENVPLKARVIDSPVLNAYASMGGYLSFHSALVDSLTRLEQLAGLVAHEFAHVQHRHSLRGMYRASANYIVLGALFGDASGMSGIILQQAESVGSLAFNRDQEAEADATARAILDERGLDRKGMAELFEVLKRESGGANIPEWLSTHPDLDARIAAAQQPTRVPVRTGVTVNEDSLRYYFDRLKLKPATTADSSSGESITIDAKAK
jgi:beta-barrel assembly-enhancing protease